MGREPKRHNIAGKVTWIGTGGAPDEGPALRGPVMTFDHYRHFGEDGPDFWTEAPNLAERIYGMNVRLTMRFNPIEQAEDDRCRRW
jgi:hypothetical protein